MVKLSYKDKRRIKMDIKKLLSKLTLEEKIYQLMQIRAYTYLYDSSLNIITGPDTK